MANPIPEFSKRYLTQVEVERQYVLYIQGNYSEPENFSIMPQTAAQILRVPLRPARHAKNNKNPLSTVHSTKFP